MKRVKQTSLLRYWTTRYLLTLFIGLLIIGLISTLWIRHNATEKRLDMLELLAEEVAERIVDNNGQLRVEPFLNRIIDRRHRFMGLEVKPFIFILDANKNMVYNAPPVQLPNEILQNIAFLDKDQNGVKKLTPRNGQTFYLVKREVMYNSQTIGWVILLHPEKEIARSKDELQLLFIMLGSLAVLGWGVIYLLTRKLSAPIKGVAEAAKQIVAGDYDIKLDKNIKEKELYELIHSFKEMSDRLQQLETMRTELLAGVTHELKTPVASISGLIQAVKDEIVTGEEAKEFLEICTKETGRLQKMVEDLLDFNSFAVGAIHVQKERQNMNRLIEEITYQWLIVQEEDTIDLSIQVPDNVIYADTDSARVQQILINLLNNAKQAVVDHGQIEVILNEHDGEIRIDVKDNGPGIPPEEQPLVFERFFRGVDRKHQVRGLGLGLTFSKMIARALGGDLVLKESSQEGTVFRLVLVKAS